MKKALSAILTLMLALSFAACGADAPASAAAPPAQAGSGAASSEAAATEVTLTAIFNEYGPYKTQMDALMEKFVAKKAEEGITVTFEAEYPSEDSVLRSRLSSGDPPDIFCYHVAIDGRLYNQGGYLPDFTGESFVDTLYPGVREAVTIDGKIVGVPMESFTWSYLYNKATFAELGLTPAQTVSEMQANIEALKAAGEVPFQTPYLDYAAHPGWTVQVPMCAMVAQLKPDFYETMNAGTGSFQSLVDIGWLDLVDMINTNGSARALEVGPEDGVANFANGEGAMMVAGPWFATRILEVNPDFQIGQAAFPIDDIAENSVVMLSVSNVMAYTEGSENAELAKEFAMFVLDGSVTNEFFESCAFNQLATNQNVKMQPWIEECVQYVDEGRSYAEFPLPNAVMEELGRASQMYYSGQMDAAAFVAALDQAWATSVAQAGASS